MFFRRFLWNYRAFFTNTPRRRSAFRAAWIPLICSGPRVQCGADVRPYYIKTSFQPEFEFEDAKRLCREIGAELTVLELDALADPAGRGATRRTAATTASGISSARSPRGRWPTATRSCSTGRTPRTTRADRPGMRALRELSVRSPLRECGLTKARDPRSFAQSGACSPGTSRPMPAWPRACPPARPSRRKSLHENGARRGAALLARLPRLPRALFCGARRASSCRRRSCRWRWSGGQSFCQS